MALVFPLKGIGSYESILKQNYRVWQKEAYSRSYGNNTMKQE